MKNHPLFNPLLYSAGLHFLFVIAAILYVLISGARFKTPVFVVSLVDVQDKGSSAPDTKNEPEELKEVSVTPPPAAYNPLKKMSSAEERIAAMQAKKNIESRRKPAKQVNISNRDIKSTSGTPGGGTYESLIQGLIRKNWATADFLNKNRGLLAIINIRVARNGQITILGWEKKSGSPLFDKEAVRALNASTPLPPPPAGEIEYSFRFSPDN